MVRTLTWIPDTARRSVLPSRGIMSTTRFRRQSRTQAVGTAASSVSVGRATYDSLSTNGSIHAPLPSSLRMEANTQKGRKKADGAKDAAATATPRRAQDVHTL